MERPINRTGTSAAEPLAYSPTARTFHWITVGLIAIMYPVAFWMTYRGNTLNVWDATTNNLYSLHKLVGFTILLLVIARLIYRFRHGAPASEPTLEPWQKAVSHLTHWSLYALLIAIPIGGWVGVQLYGARDIFGLFMLPGFLAENQDKAAQVFAIHGLAAFAMLALIGMHFGAALFHHLMRKDGVLRRMLPTLG